MPKVSVIVPVYNVEDYLESCVASILMQTEPDFECILVDDGSPDNSGALCDRLAEGDERIRVIHQQNKGLGGARNTGIEAAKGEWLLFVDSDDSIEPNTLDLALKAAGRHRAEMVLFSIETTDAAGSPQGVLRDDFPLDEPLCPARYPAVLTGMPSACNKLFARRLFMQSGIRFPEHVWYEDIRTTLKLIALCGRVTYLPNALYCYRIHGGTITKNSNAERNREILEAFADLLAWFRAENYFAAYETELAYLTVFHLYLTASVRVLRIDRKHPLIQEFAVYTKTRFPHYRDNPYLGKLDRNKRLVLSLLEKRMYRSILFIFKLKGAASRA